jgi:8-oxo-dGTP pyrophosphatase MutT (NUDIX family)
MEVFMVRRHSKSKFLPDRYVFPGGALDLQDSEPDMLKRLFPTPTEGSLFRDLPGEGVFDQVVPLTREQETGLYVATFRELFEEAGVMLALEEETGTEFNVHSEPGTAQRFAEYRHQLHDNQLRFVDILEKEKLLLEFNRLIYYSHWITPLVEPIRFDTRFFVTLAQPDQIAESDYRETTDGLWISPREALQHYEAGEFSLIYPTILHLRRLAVHDTIEEMLETARNKSVIPVSPDAINSETGWDFKLPGLVADRW